MLVSVASSLLAQWSIDGFVELDLTESGEHSHFFYNGINEDRTGWSGGLAGAAIYTGYETGNLSFNLQQSGYRYLGKHQLKYRIEQLNLTYRISENHELSIGRVINGFGSFYNQPFSHNRTFLLTPLSYAHYVNASTYLGLQQGLGENGYISNGTTDWGSPTNYQFAYVNGLKWYSTWGDGRWNSDVNVGFVRFNSGLSKDQNFQVSGRLSMDVNWSFYQGLSFRYVRFGPSSDGEYEELSISQKGFHQFQLAYDFTWGFSFFEVTSELIWSNYGLPLHNGTIGGYAITGNTVPNQSASSTSLYIDITYEPPFLSGSFIGLRSESLSFSEINGQSWDRDVDRHNVVIGYKISPNLLFRIQWINQEIQGRTWDQDVFQLAITAHL